MKRLIVLAMITALFANDHKNSKQNIKNYKEELVVTENTNLTVEAARGSDVHITASPDNKIYLKLRVEITDLDNDKVLPEQLNLLQVNGNNVRLNLEKIYLSMAEEYRPGFFEKIFSKFGAGKEGKVTRFNNATVYTKDGQSYLIPSHIMTLELAIPKIKEFSHTNKYGTAMIETIDAKEIEFDMYQTELTLKEAKGNVDITDKYSTAIIQNVAGYLKGNFYELDLKIENVGGNLDITNKYTKTVITNVEGSAEFIGYELDLSIDKVGGDLNLENKYQLSRVRNVKGNAVVRLYESETNISNVDGDLDLSNKYKPTTLENIGGSVRIDLYSSNLISESTGKGMSGEMKSGTASIHEIKGPIDLTGYEISYNIKNCADLRLNFKYGDLDLSGTFGNVALDSYSGDLKINKAITRQIDIDIKQKYGSLRLSGFEYDKYRIKAKTKHGKISILNLEDELNDDKDELKYQWSKRDLKTIMIDGYDLNITME